MKRRGLVWLLLVALLIPALIIACAVEDNDDGGDDPIDDDADGDDAADDDDLDDDDDIEPPDRTISVLTINLQNAWFNPREIDRRAGFVAELMLEREVDFVTLQEVVQFGDVQNRAQYIAGLAGYEYVWLRTHNVPLIFEEGVAVLSRWPIVSSDSVELPHPELGGIFTRAVLGVIADTPQGELACSCSHMTTADDEDKKADQALAAYEFVDSQRNGLPGWFAGDLNAEPETLAMRFLRGEAQYEGQSGDLLDSWSQINPDDPGYSFPAEDPDRRIDYIYLVPSAEAPTTVVSCEIVFDEPIESLWVSDHAGVLCQFELPTF
ncbi:MAG: endonuclease/exonuclease/phosphatase family protein [Candidatus Alcyoniella australis]|nr:endonuclease/exonuclease/phosphatase family protein [Candidatus Alcyoniella australis]